jgi:AraC family transcriptional regulator, transcriptional activator of the genes for pyochelin and ferripyochelin receptors
LIDLVAVILHQLIALPVGTYHLSCALPPHSENRLAEKSVNTIGSIVEIISAQAYDDQFEEALQSNGIELFGQNGFDLELRLRDRFGKDWERRVELRPGLDLWVVDYDSYYDLNRWYHHECQPPLVSSFRLSSSYRALVPSLTDTEEMAEEAGHHYLYYLPSLDRIEQWFAGNRYWDILIFIDLDILYQYCFDSNLLPGPMLKLIQQEAPDRFFQPIGTITPQMLMLIQQIWIAPFQHLMQRMYLDSCVMQLLALQFNQWLCSEQTHARVRNFTSTEVDKIHYARELLMDQPHNPPSPVDLAKLVHLSERKLQKGFRELFGTTVFGYLHSYRMEQAKLLLCDRDTSIAAVANTVGYAHLGHFAAAFKKKFGVAPRVWQQSRNI